MPAGTAPEDGSHSAIPSPDGLARREEPTVPVAEALSVVTRAGIYRRLRMEGRPLSAREVADMFGLHSNVARNHLDVLHGAGLVVTGRRKHPGGGRPAKVYVAREQADDGRSVAVPPGSQLAVSVLVGLVGDSAEAADRAERVAEEQGRRLVEVHAGRADARDLDAAAVVAVEALRSAFPEVRLVEDGQTGESETDAVRLAGLEVGLRLVGEVDAALGDAMARGFARGALRAAGAAVRVTSSEGRVRAEIDEDGAAEAPVPVATVDARGQTYQAGVVTTMRAIMPLRPGEHLEVLTDVRGAPAAFARWADRAGHPVIDVKRVRDMKGHEAVRLLLRKAEAT